MMGQRTIAMLSALCLAVLIALTGCFGDGFDPKHPVTLTMWHNFGGEPQKTINALLDEFNSTVGKERGIIINVTAVTSSAEMAETLTMIANGDPGAPEMPDLSVCYPKSAVQFQGQGRLANLDDYFTKEELSAYVPAFIEEGRFGDGGLYVFPFAKSTEIVYLNQTLFDRFAAETGITMDCFDTFEGIAQTASIYYEWTDAKTPDVPNDGKQFFAADSWLNLAQTGVISMGESLFAGERLNLDSAAYRRIWDAFYRPAVSGGVALYEGYSSDLHKTGDLLCSTGSSAGIIIYGDTVTYPDNRTEQVEYSILPYPMFEGGKKTVIQRGSGICVAASENKIRERAASEFLKWFTEPERNMRFVSSTGYLPVTIAAFESEMSESAKDSFNPNVSKLMQAFMQTREEYVFFVPPVFDGYDILAKEYESEWLAYLSARRDAYAASGDADDVTGQSEAALKGFMPAHRGR